jgi:autotransporter translocation and assembly factor TamB
MVRKLLLIGGAAVVVGGLLLYGILTGLFLTPTRDAAVQAILRMVSDRLPGSLEVGSVQGSLLSTPVVQNIVIKDAQGTVIGQVDTLRLSYDLWSLLRLRLVVHEVSIERPQFTLTEEPDGALNISRAFASPRPGQPKPPRERGTNLGLPFAIVVESVRVDNGEVTLGLPALPGVRQVAGIQLEAQADLDARGIRAGVRALAAATSPAQVDVRALHGTFQWVGGAMRLDDLRLELGQTVLTADGALPHPQQAANFTLRLDPLDVTEIGRLLQREILQGRWRVAVEVEGPPEALAASVDLNPLGERETGAVAVRGEVNTQAAPLRYRAQVDIGHLDLSTVLHKSAWQSDLNLQAHLEGEGVAPRELDSHIRVDIQPSHLGNIGLRPSQIDLQARGGRFQVQRFEVETTLAQVHATGAVDLSGRSDLRYEMTASLESLKQLLDEERLAGEVHLQGQASGDWPDLQMRGELDGRRMQYQAYGLDRLQLTYEGAQLGTTPQGTAQLQLQRAHLGTVPVAQVELQGTYDGSARQLEFTVDVDQAPGNNLHTQGSLTIQATGQRVDLLQLRFHLAERLWQMTAPLQVSHAGERLEWTPLHVVHADESVDITGGLIGTQLQDIRVQATHLDLSILPNLMAAEGPMQGRADFQALLSGTLPAPLLNVDLHLRPEGRQSLPFQDVQASLAYAQQLLQGQVRMRQQDREVLAVDLRVPIDLALTALPPDERVVEGPIALDVRLRQPDLASLTRWYQRLPQLAGTLNGTIGLQGSATELDLTADLHLQKLGVQHAIEQLDGTVALTGHMIAAPSLQALKVDLQRGDLTLTADPVALRLPTLQGQLPAREGPVQPFEIRNLEMQAHGQWSPRHIVATLQTLHLQAKAFGLPSTDLLIEAALTPERLNLQRLQVRLPQSEIRGHGGMALADQQVQFRLEIPHLDLGEFPLPLPPDLPRQVQGVLTANGTLKAPQAELRLTYAGAQIGADLDAQLQEAPPRYQARLRVDGLNIARLAPNLTGELQTALQLQGSGFTAEQRRATLQLTVDSRNLSVAPGLTVRLQSQLAGQTLDLQELRVASEPAQLIASGRLSTARDAAVTYTLALGDLTPLQSVLGAALQASGTLTGKVSGPLNALQTTGALRLKNWRYAALSGGTVDADFSAAQLPAAPQGSVKLQVADVQAPSLPATSLRLEAGYVPPRGRVTASVTKGPYQRTTLGGTLALNAGQRVTLDRLQLQLRDLLWQNDGPVEVARNAQGAIDIRRFNLRSGAQRLRMTGTLAPGGALSADVRVQQVQIGPNVRAVMPEASLPDGQLSLDMSLAGTLQQPQGKGTLQLTSLAWQEHQLGDMHATVTLNGQTARTDLRWRLEGRELLQVQGGVGLSAAGPLALRVRAPNLPLDMVQRMIPGVAHSAGTFDLDLRADGTLQQPRLNGSLTLDNGELQLTVTGERYRDMRLHIELTGDRVDIRQLHVGSQTGSLEVRGWAQLAGVTLRQVDVTVQARQFTAINTPAIQAVTTMDLVVRGSQQAMTATGTITVPRLRVQVNKIPGSGPRVVQPWELTVEGVYGPGPQAMAGSENGASTSLRLDVPLSFLRADIRVEIPRNAWIQAPGTAIEISGDLHIAKELEQPFILSGTITIVRGFASVYGKRFVMRQGQIVFTGTPDINPLLDITVNYTVSNYLVQIHVEGRAREPQISFSSTPELPQTDILSLLIVGKTMDRLTGSEQEKVSNQLTGAAGSIVAGQLQEIFGGALGLDTLSIGAGEHFAGGSVSIGQYVTQTIFLSYEVGMGKGGGNRVAVEYSITPRLMLKGSTSDNGASAVDLLWRRDY